MKFNALFMSMCVGMALVGCSSDDVVVSSGNNDAIGETQYLTVNLVTNGESGTRADANNNNQQSGDPTNKVEDNKTEQSTYEKGTTEENTVTTVRFYFFTKDGNAAKVRKDGENFLNYIDWTKDSINNGGDNMPNVEKILSATLVLQSPKGDDTSTPAKLVAIINPKEDINTDLSLDGLKGVADDYAAYTTEAFEMSNSTYKDGDEQMEATIGIANLCKNAEAAKANPVDIYVERTMAKVRLNCSLTKVEGTTLYDPSTKDKTETVDGTKEGEKLYVKFLGWNTTAVASASRLIKKIDTNWASDLLGGYPWNWAEYHRSFWATNADGIGYLYGKFQLKDGETTKTDNHNVAVNKTKFNKSEYVYINENAPKIDNKNNGDTTKVIIAAQLVKKDGTPITVAEYGATRVTVDRLKELYANSCNLYKKTIKGEGENATTKFTKIEANDITFKTASAVLNNGKVDSTKAGRYYVYAQLTDNAAGETWCASKEENAETVTNPNDKLKDLGPAKIWNNGLTYYYFDIEHLNKVKGVVRNHIYDATIESLAGLGTPVYNPDEIIYPEKPNNEYTYIAAKINILSWRVVNSNVSLEW